MEGKKICVFCGSNEGNDPVFRAAAEQLTEEIVRRGYGIVYGGGLVGLMGAVATKGVELGAEVIGVIPQTLTEREIAYEGVTDLRVTATMHERKAMMNDLSEAFVALPGGFGTLEELFEVITWAQLGIHAKPFGLLDVDGFYRPLMDFLDAATERGFIRPVYRNMVRSSESPAELLDRLEAWEPPGPIGWPESQRAAD